MNLGFTIVLSFIGICHLRPVTALCEDVPPGKSTCTRGTKGIPCGNNTCIKGEACCVHDKCECRKPATSGCGTLCCWDPCDYDGGIILNDPRVKTMSKESALFPYPCRYFVTHAKTDLLIKRRHKLVKQGVCVFHIHAWNVNIGGRFFVHGVDIAIRAEFQKQHCGKNTKLKATFRVQGEASHGRYQFSEWGEKEYNEDGTLNSQDVNIRKHGVDFQIRYDKHQNYAYFVSEACGVNWRFRPADKEFGIHQPYTPGLCVRVNKKHNPVYRSEDQLILFTPNTTLADAQREGLTEEQSLFARAFNPSVAQTQPCASECCKELNDLVNECRGQNLYEVIERCYWMFRSRKFVGRNDQDPQAGFILDLAKDCTLAVTRGKHKCLKFEHRVNNDINYPHNDIEELNNWRSGANCGH